MHGDTQYSDATRIGLQCIFGAGFTSPGGVDYMRLLLNGLDISGMTVLDLGCGLGGDSLLLGREFGAASVYSVDVDPENLAITETAVQEAGLEDTIHPTLVEPGPLPFEDSTFDVAHTKAMLCHIPADDLTGLFVDVFRVLRPGGCLVAADWMAGPDSAASNSYKAFVDDLDRAGLRFFFKGVGEHVRALRAAGFESIDCRDMTKQIHAYAEDIVNQVEGAARDELIAAMGKDGYAGMVIRNRGRADALGTGDLQFQYIKAERMS